MSPRPTPGYLLATLRVVKAGLILPLFDGGHFHRLAANVFKIILPAMILSCRPTE
jgi:cytochrome c oxidase subunit IV